MMTRITAILFLCLAAGIPSAAAHAQGFDGLLSPDTSAEATTGNLSEMREQLRLKRAQQMDEVDAVNLQLMQSQLDTLANPQAADDAASAYQPAPQTAPSGDDTGAFADTGAAAFSFIAPDPAQQPATAGSGQNSGGGTTDTTMGGILAP